MLLICLACWISRSEASAALLGLQDKAIASTALKDAGKGQWKKALEHAARASNNVVATLIEWQRVQAASGPADFADIISFLHHHPDWPERERIILRAEERLKDSQPDELIIEWFGHFPPRTARGKWRYAEALMRQKSIDADALEGPFLAQMKDAWHSDGLTLEEQRAFLARYGRYLTAEDHRRRIDALLWEQRATIAEPLLSLVSVDQQALFKARILLMRNRNGVDAAMRRVPDRLIRDPGLIYERVRWRARRGRDNGVRELLALAPRQVPKPSLWWEHRKKQVHKLLDEERYEQAYRIVAAHKQQDGIGFVEAEWLSGWIALSFLKQPATAYEHFYKLHHGANFPISKARGAFWAGLSAELNANTEIADQWYIIASEFPATFYGQLALHRIQSSPRLALPEPEDVPGSEFRAFRERETSQAFMILIETGYTETARRFLLALIERADSARERTMLARLGFEARRVDLAVKAAKKSLHQGTLLPRLGYPIIHFQPKRHVEKALVMAVIRQESEFRLESRSHAGALGLMQVLPTTAKQVSRRLNLRYSRHKLANSRIYNLQIGSAYLADLLERYDGSYLLAIAAYNAGPGRINRWLKTYGDPRTGEVHPLLWIERIPFKETRNYVQRVLENLQIYRLRMQDKTSGELRIARDIHDAGGVITTGFLEGRQEAATLSPRRAADRMPAPSRKPAQRDTLKESELVSPSPLSVLPVAKPNQ